MKCSLGISNFVEEICSLSHSIVFLFLCVDQLGRLSYLFLLFLRNLYAGQEGTVRTGHGTTDWFQIGEGVRQGCILSPLLTYIVMLI